jgi:predicted ester cyclase
MNMENEARKLMEALEKGDREGAGQYVTDDFTVTGPTPDPIGKAEFLGLHYILAQAFPDFSFNVIQVKQQGDEVEGTIHITGTQTGVLDVSEIGLPIPPLQPTGKKVVMPEEHPVLTIRGDKFSSLHLPKVPGGGLPGILQQLGLQMPAMP